MSNIVPGGSSLHTQHGDFSKQLNAALTQQVKGKPYTAYITRTTPSAFVFLIDQSGSMDNSITINGKTIKKSEFLADGVNGILNSILLRCTKGSEIRDYFDIAVIGYGGSDDNEANFAWQGKLEGKKWIRPSELLNNHLGEIEEEVSTMVRGVERKSMQKRKYWIEPVANHQTPMKHAMNLAAELLEEWIVQYKGKDVYPPTLFNITDGQFNDATFEEMLDVAQRLKKLHTIDGDALIFNMHIEDSGEKPVLFPHSKDDLPDSEYAQLLFDVSSDLPVNYMKDAVALLKKDLESPISCMAYNASLDIIINIMNIGTSTTLKQISA